MHLCTLLCCRTDLCARYMFAVVCRHLCIHVFLCVMSGFDEMFCVLTEIFVSAHVSPPSFTVANIAVLSSEYYDVSD